MTRAPLPFLVKIFLYLHRLVEETVLKQKDFNLIYYYYLFIYIILCEPINYHIYINIFLFVFHLSIYLYNTM